MGKKRFIKNIRKQIRRGNNALFLKTENKEKANSETAVEASQKDAVEKKLQDCEDKKSALSKRKLPRYEVRCLQRKPEFLAAQHIQGNTVSEILRVAVLHSGYQEFMIHDRQENINLRCCQGRIYSIFRVLFSRYFVMALSDFPALFSNQKILFVRSSCLPRSPEEYDIVVSRDGCGTILYQSEEWVPNGKIC